MVGSRRCSLPFSVVAVAVLIAAGLVVVASGVVVAEIVDEVMDSDADANPDERVVEWVSEHRTAAAASFFKVTTHLATTWFVTIVVAVAAVVHEARHRPALAVAVVISSAGAALWTSLLKELVGRDRPPPLTRLVDASGHSLPSGHSSQAVACYGALALVLVVIHRDYRVRVGALLGAAIIVVVVGASRVYLGVHWPSDVVIGWIVGGAWLVWVAAGSWVLWKLDRPRGWWAPPDHAS